MSVSVHDGGKFIASGSFGCVHYPHLQCSNGKNVPKAVGKLFFDPIDMEEEMKTAMHVQKVIDPQHKFTIPLVGKCQVKKFMERDQFKLCPTPYKNTNPQRYYQLLYPHAGKSVLSIIAKAYKSKSTLTNHFIKIVLCMQNIIDGLKTLNKHHYIHADIKLDNLMMKKGKLHLIDFGIAQHEATFYNPKTNYGTLSADQVYYPPEFKAFVNNFTSFQDFHSNFLQSWKNDGELYKVLKNIHVATYNQDMHDVYKMSRRSIQNQASKADTFSLGIELLELLLICRIPQDVSSRNKRMITFVNMYLDLVRGMTRLNPKERWSVSQVQQHYAKIVKQLHST